MQKFSVERFAGVLLVQQDGTKVVVQWLYLLYYTEYIRRKKPTQRRVRLDDAEIVLVGITSARCEKNRRGAGHQRRSHTWAFRFCGNTVPPRPVLPRNGTDHCPPATSRPAALSRHGWESIARLTGAPYAAQPQHLPATPPSTRLPSTPSPPPLTQPHSSHLLSFSNLLVNIITFKNTNISTKYQGIHAHTHFNTDFLTPILFLPFIYLFPPLFSLYIIPLRPAAAGFFNGII